MICIDGVMREAQVDEASDIAPCVFLGVELDPDVFTLGDVLSCNG